MSTSKQKVLLNSSCACHHKGGGGAFCRLLNVRLHSHRQVARGVLLDSDSFFLTTEKQKHKTHCDHAATNAHKTNRSSQQSGGHTQPRVTLVQNHLRLDPHGDPTKKQRRNALQKSSIGSHKNVQIHVVDQHVGHHLRTSFSADALSSGTPPTQ